MQEKVPVDAMTAEMRVLSELSATASESDTWLTPAFWTMAGAAMTNLITVAVLIGWVDATQAEGLTGAATALLGAAQVIVVNSVLVWKYISGRNQVQIAKLNAQAHYLELVAVEKLQARK